MKRFGFFFVLLMASGSLLMGQSLDDVLAKHAKAAGYEKLAKVKSVRIEGVMTRGTREVPFTILVKGDKIRYESDMQGRKMVQVYDGEKGWFYSPRSQEIREMPKRLVRVLKERSSLAGPLSHWKEMTDKLQLEGKTKLKDGTEAFKIKYTRPGGAVTMFFISTENYLLIRSTEYLSVNGHDIKRLVLFSSYEDVEGVKIAFSRKMIMEGTPGGSGRRARSGSMEIRYKKVEFNVPLDDSLFTKTSLTQK